MNEVDLLEQVLFELDEVKAILKVLSCLDEGVDMKSISLVSITYYEKLVGIYGKLEKAIRQE